MPIYAYRCEDCGHAQDFLQKMSDPLIAVCPNCGSANFRKQLTAAGFQLKGGGWYVTDFRDNGKKDGKKEAATGVAAPNLGGDAKADGGGKSESAAPAASSGSADSSSGGSSSTASSSSAASGGSSSGSSGSSGSSSSGSSGGSTPSSGTKAA